MENFCPEISKRRNKVSIQSQFDSLLSDLTTTDYGRRRLRQVSRHLLQQPNCLSAGVQLAAAFCFFFLRSFIVKLIYFCFDALRLESSKRISSDSFTAFEGRADVSRWSLKTPPFQKSFSRTSLVFLLWPCFLF